MDPIIAALLRERSGYLRRGLPDRAAEVDAQLTRLGYETATAELPEPPASVAPETASLEASETAVIPRPRPRKREPSA